MDSSLAGRCGEVRQRSWVDDGRGGWTEMELQAVRLGRGWALRRISSAVQGWADSTRKSTAVRQLGSVGLSAGNGGCDADGKVGKQARWTEYEQWN
ncbi:hypothetical protein M0R45_009241 [Rubus argutus]|uniref:Uncharacterized protein n=1 Tax=Rubus argutus TaxID=59490 RepID=A0AAW1Y4D6_RUBAR